jgi:hypothetical protein
MEFWPVLRSRLVRLILFLVVMLTFARGRLGPWLTIVKAFFRTMSPWFDADVFWREHGVE